MLRLKRIEDEIIQTTSKKPAIVFAGRVASGIRLFATGITNLIFIWLVVATISCKYISPICATNADTDLNVIVAAKNGHYTPGILKSLGQQLNENQFKSLKLIYREESASGIAALQILGYSKDGEKYLGQLQNRLEEAFVHLSWNDKLQNGETDRFDFLTYNFWCIAYLGGKGNDDAVTYLERASDVSYWEKIDINENNQITPNFDEKHHLVKIQLISSLKFLKLNNAKPILTKMMLDELKNKNSEDITVTSIVSSYVDSSVTTANGADYLFNFFDPYTPRQINHLGYIYNDCSNFDRIKYRENFGRRGVEYLIRSIQLEEYSVECRIKAALAAGYTGNHISHYLLTEYINSSDVNIFSDEMKVKDAAIEALGYIGKNYVDLGADPEFICVTLVKYSNIDFWENQLHEVPGIKEIKSEELDNIYEELMLSSLRGLAHTCSTCAQFGFSEIKNEYELSHRHSNRMKGVLIESETDNKRCVGHQVAPSAMRSKEG